MISMHLRKFCTQVVIKNPLKVLVKNGGLSLTDVVVLTEICPQIEQLTERHISKRYSQLSLIFNPNKIATLIRMNPNILIEKWNFIEKKLKYLEEQMLVDKSLIPNTSALVLKLEELEVRHKFLERSGQYTLHDMPALKYIAHTDDLTFAKDVALLSLEEFEVFKEMYKEEKYNEDRLSDDSDTDSDNETYMNS